MTITTVTTLTALALAAGVAWWLGGTQGAGVLAGFLAGASIAGLSLALQRRVALRRPRYAFHAVLGAFLLKAVALLTLTLLVRHVPALAAVCDAPAFLFGCAGAILVLLVPGTLDLVRLLENPCPPASLGQGVLR